MLDGRVIAITRDEEGAKEFVRMVESRNGKVIALPTISLVPRDPATMIKFVDMIKAKKHDYVLLMSANAVKIMFDVFATSKKTGDVARLLNSSKVIAVGPHTKQELENYNVNVSMMPEKYSSYGVIEILSKENCKGKKIIIPRSSASTNYLAKSLSDLGMIVDEVHVYDVKPSTHDKWSEFMNMLAQNNIDCIVFTSASSVNSFFEVATQYEKNEHLVEILNSIKIIAIGPFTNDILIEHGVKAVMSHEHTINGTFEVAVKLLGK
jgi:uroporphyrinogen-III synthase